MKRNFSVVLACLLAGVVIILFLKMRSNSPRGQEQLPNGEPTKSVSASPSRTNASSPASSTASSSPPAAATPTASTPNSSSAKSVEATATTGNSAVNGSDENNFPPEIVLQNVRRAVHQYGDMFGGNPVGTNPEITAALAGSNPKHINFLNGQPGIRVNDNGELIDTWGTPYFFHQLSGTVMEIHSAGPDKRMWTSDDLVTK